MSNNQCPNYIQQQQSFLQSAKQNGLNISPEQQQIVSQALTKLNNLQSTDIVKCDEECERRKLIQQKFNELRNASSNYFGNNDANNYENAREGYYTLTIGSNGYFNILNREANREADELVSYIEKTVNDRKKIIDILLSTYKETYNDIPYLEDGNKNYDKKMDNLLKRLGIRENQVNISDRKVYYEDGVVNIYSSYVNKLSIVAWILFIVYALYVFAYLRIYNKKQIFVVIGIAIVLYMIQFFTFKLVDIYKTWMSVENEFCELEDFGEV